MNKVIIISHTTDLSKTAKRREKREILKPKLNMSGGIIGGGKRIIKYVPEIKKSFIKDPLNR